MPLEAYSLYLYAKYDRECYELDCLWTLTNDRKFMTYSKPPEPQENITTPTIPLWRNRYDKASPAQQSVASDSEMSDEELRQKLYGDIAPKD